MLDTIPLKTPRSPPQQDAGWGAEPIWTIMTRNVSIVSENMGLKELSRCLVGARTTSAAVQNDAGNMTGHVSMIDIVRHQCRDGASTATVREVMRPFILAVQEDSTIGRAAAIMAFENIDRVFVSAQDGNIVGWACALDVLRGLTARDGYAGMRGREGVPDGSSYTPGEALAYEAR